MFLENPTELRGDKTITSYYKDVEKYLFDELVKLKAKRIESTTRIKPTEWIYCNEKQLLKAFQTTQTKYGGTLIPYHLKNINTLAKEESKKKHYDGEIYFNV